MRIILSGHAEIETALRSVPVAHQFLNKPCEPGVLESVIERACSLQSLVNNEAVMQAVGKIEKLPSLPRVYSQLMAALSRENTSTDDVARILKQDMAICAKTLEVVNSAFFRLPRSIGKIEEAVRYLGLTTVKHIVLAVEVFQRGEGYDRPPPGFPIELLQQHSLLVGEVAAGFFSDKQTKEDAFVVGLLHDIGKLLLAVELPDHLQKALLEMQATDCAMYIAEERLWGVTHAEVGGYLLGLGGLPLPIIEAVANHHVPSRVETKEFDILAATHIADVMVRAELDGQVSTKQSVELDLAFIDRIGASDNLDIWREQVGSHVRKRGDQKA